MILSFLPICGRPESTGITLPPLPPVFSRVICGLDAPGDLFYFYLVPSPAKNAGPNNPAKPENLPFEAALKKLEAIVEAMESEDLPLETLLGKYEEGTHLARVCQEKLAEAELKIQQLEKNAAGEMKLKPLSPEESEQV